jgi:hypothetical protein
MTTETLDKLYLEWSHFTHARNARERILHEALEVADAALDHVQAHLRNGSPPQDSVMTRARSAIASALLAYSPPVGRWR